jgi:plastocyanin
MTSSTLQRLGTGLLVTSLALAFGVACSNDDNDSVSGNGGTTATTAAQAAATTVPQLTAPTSSDNPNNITIQNFTFMGLDAAKANVTWSITNQDSVPHTVSADDNSFVWRVEPGQTAPFAKTLAPGSYPVHCDIHPARMKGVLVVK